MDGSKGIKIILLGETGVGKTNLINVASGGEFDPDNNSSISSSFTQNVFDYNNKRYIFSLWDTAGQERFRSLNQIFIKGSKIIMIVFAIDNQNSFDQINYWVEYVKDILGKDNYILALVANKSDLFEEQVISDEDIINKAKEYNIKFVITSACADAAGFKKFIHELILDYIHLIGPEGEKELYFQLVNDDKEQQSKTNKTKKCC